MKPDSYEYDFDKFIASFVGFFPVDNPQYVLVVCYDIREADVQLWPSQKWSE